MHVPLISLPCWTLHAPALAMHGLMMPYECWASPLIWAFFRFHFFARSIWNLFHDSFVLFASLSNGKALQVVCSEMDCNAHHQSHRSPPLISMVCCSLFFCFNLYCKKSVFFFLGMSKILVVISRMIVFLGENFSKRQRATCSRPTQSSFCLVASHEFASTFMRIYLLFRF